MPLAGSRPFRNMGQRPQTTGRPSTPRPPGATFDEAETVARPGGPLKNVPGRDSLKAAPIALVETVRPWTQGPSANPARLGLCRLAQRTERRPNFAAMPGAPLSRGWNAGQAATASSALGTLAARLAESARTTPAR